MIPNRKNNISVLPVQKCTGCHSCFLSCPRQCISMQENPEGFFYPSVNEAVCINCGICVKHCPILTPCENHRIRPERYAVILKDKKTLAKSSSGGLFAGIASYFLENGGIVFGSAYDENLIVRHILVERNDELYKIQGSKYVESDIGEIFRKVQDYLREGREVLFSGTPCQVAGLRSFLGREYDNLCTIDLICHGVPSLKLFHKYLTWLGKKNHGKIIYYGFRDKDISGWSCGGKVLIKTKTKTIEGFCDPYYHSFLMCESYRESCYVCSFANAEARSGDISVGDFWGTDKAYPEISQEQGISFCSVNTLQGQKIFKFVRERFEVYECPENETLSVNIAYHQPSVRPASRDFIYDGIDGDLDIYFKSFKHPKYFWFIMGRFFRWMPRPAKDVIKKVLGRT